MILWDHRYLQSPLNLIAIRFWKVKVQNKVENISDNVDDFSTLVTALSITLFGNSFKR
jgi:hypothetical protein